MLIYLESSNAVAGWLDLDGVKQSRRLRWLDWPGAEWALTRPKANHRYKDLDGWCLGQMKHFRLAEAIASGTVSRTNEGKAKMSPPAKWGLAIKQMKCTNLLAGLLNRRRQEILGCPTFSIVERDKKDPRFKGIYRMEAVSVVGVPLHTHPLLGIICYNLLEFDNFSNPELIFLSDSLYPS